jgi:hypothetical protein
VTVVLVANPRTTPSSYGYYGLFLGTVGIVCGVLVGNTFFFGLGAASMVFGLGYLAAVRKRSRG